MSLELVNNQRGASRHVTTPRLPAIARDSLDDAREVLAESMAPALRSLLALLTRPQRCQLVPWKRLPVEQARMFIDQLAALPRDSEIERARQLGRLEVHALRLLDVIDSEVAPW